MISVIISVYNDENNLYNCLNSILKQTYTNFEVVCVDDASTDSSFEILEYFSQKDSRIKVHKNIFNKGLGYCRNVGLKNAKGDYVIFLNGDNWLTFNALEILINKAKENQLDVLFFKSFVLNREIDFEIDDLENIDFLEFENKIFNHYDLKKNEVFTLENNISNKFFLKSLFDDNDIEFPNENKINLEIPFLYNVITSANNISMISDHLLNCSGKTNQLSNLNSERLFDCIDIAYMIMNVFLDNNQLYKYYKKELLIHIFERLHELYCQIDSRFKERFFMEVQAVYKNFIKYYGLYDDIVENVDGDILSFFKFDEIMDIINNPPKTSIILPVYNTEKELPQVLDSIVNQTIGIDDIEVIVIDDFSSDGSWEIIEDYSKRYESIRTIRLYENTGSPSKPRNIGIRNANSDYIMFHDSDDCFMLDACEVMYETMIDEDVDFVSGMITRNDNGETYEIAYDPWDSILRQYDKYKKEDVKEILRSDDLITLRINSFEENKSILADYSLNSKLLKKSLFINNNIKYPEGLNGAEDTVVLFSCLIKSKVFAFVNKVIFGYDVNRIGSLTHNFSLKTIQSRPEAYKLMYDFAVSNHQKSLFLELVLWRKLNYWVNNHLLIAPDLKSEDILSIFKTYQIIFSECLSYSRLPEFLKELCEDIKNNSFEDAVRKIMLKRLECSNSELQSS